MSKIASRLRADERGANLVEMVLVTLLLLLLVMGVADFGRAFNNYIIITNAAREGARYASRYPHLPDQIRAATIREAADSGVTLVDGNISIVGLYAAPGTPIEVRVEYQFPTIMGSMIGIGDLTLRSRTQMVVFGGDQT